jgi:hypothetical protein
MPAPDPTPTTDDPAAPVFAEPDVPGAPDVADVVGRIRAEYGRFTARQDLLVHGILAVRAGGAVPVHHPHVPQWLADGLLEDATPGVDIVPEALD